MPIGPYIVDFIGPDARLIAEIDGGQHVDNVQGRKRDDWLRSQGFNVLRFWNNDVLSTLGGTLEVIAQAVTPTAPSSLALPRKGAGNALRRG